MSLPFMTFNICEITIRHPLTSSQFMAIAGVSKREFIFYLASASFKIHVCKIIRVNTKNKSMKNRKFQLLL